MKARHRDTGKIADAEWRTDEDDLLSLWVESELVDPDAWQIIADEDELEDLDDTGDEDIHDHGGYL